ncbi:hypothetical protein B7494_g6524 [Chlorociboria aeruginascens]|nr:hypothetical protein B7494_g6524 [Chlorociboria aeruginascens]
MSPPVIAGPESAAKDYKRESTLARLLGSGSAGIAELAVFHPVDTIAKRLMSNQVRITTASQLNSVIFKESAAAPVGKKFFSLFPGLGYAAGYKVLQRVYKYGGQPFVRDYLAKNHGTTFDNTFGAKTGKAMMHSFAGSIIGIGEIVLLPLDVLKIKRQTNPEAFRGRGVFAIVRDESFGLYRGWGWTAARNAPGSFALFGGSAFTKGYLYGLTDYNKATWLQNFVASIAGASASLVVSAPLDVIKTRIQNRNFENPESGFKIVGSMVKNEGLTSFFKGLVPKLLMTGPKLDMLDFDITMYFDTMSGSDIPTSDIPAISLSNEDLISDLDGVGSKDGGLITATTLSPLPISRSELDETPIISAIASPAMEQPQKESRSGRDSMYLPLTANHAADRMDTLGTLDGPALNENVESMPKDSQCPTPSDAVPGRLIRNAEISEFYPRTFVQPRSALRESSFTSSSSHVRGECKGNFGLNKRSRLRQRISKVLGSISFRGSKRKSNPGDFMGLPS